jgi:general L-amino acid transport system permease protein
MSFAWFYHPTVRSVLAQALALVCVVVLGAYLVTTTLDNLNARGITTGFAFLHKEAGFQIGETLLPYTPADSYGRAIVVGLLNTFKVAGIAIALATLCGLVLGILRLAPNPLLAGVARGYVEAVRNVPLLLQLFLWYTIISDVLPPPRQAIEILPHVYLSNRGLLLPWPDSWWPFVLSVPELKRFNFVGGIGVSPEFLALLFGLVVYATAFIGEIVRSGIQSVGKGQREAAEALGLPYGVTLRRVILPQALRLIIPPLTSQYLNIIKNSSLAVAIGYPDLVALTNITINQTGQAIEGIAIIMAAYLTINLVVSFLMNVWNGRALRGGAA